MGLHVINKRLVAGGRRWMPSVLKLVHIDIAAWKCRYTAVRHAWLWDCTDRTVGAYLQHGRSGLSYARSQLFLQPLQRKATAMLFAVEILCAIEIKKRQCEQWQSHQNTGIESHLILVDIVASASSIVGFDWALYALYGKYCVQWSREHVLTTLAPVVWQCWLVRMEHVSVAIAIPVCFSQRSCHDQCLRMERSIGWSFEKGKSVEPSDVVDKVAKFTHTLCIAGSRQLSYITSG